MPPTPNTPPSPLKAELERLQLYLEECPAYPLTAANLIFVIASMLQLLARIEALESGERRQCA